MSKVVIYTRVSDPSQIDNNSLDTQRRICERFAESKDLEVVKIFREEGKSAKHINSRPVLRELIKFCTNKKNAITTLIVYKFDRFSRNTHEGLATISLLAKDGVEVVSATEVSDMNPMGKAIRTVLMAFGELDNEMKGERVRDNMKAVFRKGLWPFKPPIGYKRKYNNKEQNRGIPPIQDENLAPIIENLFNSASKGIYSKAQLGRMMNLEGFETHYGIPANHKTVKLILEKTFYHGLMYGKKWNEYCEGRHDPIIDKGTWDKSYQLVVLKNKKITYRDSKLYPLKGSLKCEVCDEVMTTCPSRGDTTIVYYYECKKKECRKVRIDSRVAHAQFNKIISDIRPSRRIIKIFNKMVFSEWDQVIAQAKKQIVEFDNRILGLKKEIKNIRKALDREVYTEEEAREEAKKVRQEIVVLEIERSDIKFEQYDTEIVRNFTESFLLHLDILWEKMDLVKRQILLKRIFPNGIICAKNKKIRTIDLSPSFQLINVLSDQKGKKVSSPRIELGSRV